MTTLFIAMIILFYGYTGYIVFKYGTQKSVSESYYRLPVKRRFVFTAVTVLYAVLAMIIGLELTGSGLVYLAGLAIAFVGAAPAFKDDKLQKTVHMVGAVVGITAMHVFLITQGAWVITLCFAIASAVAFINRYMNNHFVWHVECYAFISIAVFYAVKLFA